MKKKIFLGLAISFLASMVWAQEKVEAPVWNVGDKWTYKRADGGTWTNEVVEVKEDLFILKVGGSRELNAYDKKTMNVKYLIEEGGRQVESESGTRNLLDFPLFVGKKWSDSTSGINPYDTQKRSGKTIYTHDFKVEAIEDVTTAAGTIKAYKIYYVGSNKNTRSSGWIRYWYSPEAKTWVKRQVEKSTYWALSTWAKDAELISSHLK